MKQTAAEGAVALRQLKTMHVMDNYMQDEKKKLLTLLQGCSPDRLPPCGLYSRLLSFVGATEENRKCYGLQTCREWLGTIATF